MNTSRPPLLPGEHGAWAFLLLPTLSALALSPSWAGFALLGMALSAFLGRVPFRRISRGSKASTFDRRWLLGYGSAGMLCLGLAIRGKGLEPLLPLLPALPLGAWLVRIDLKGGARSLLAEWAAIAVPSFLGVAMVHAGQGPWRLAWVLGGGSFISLAAPVTYLRSRLASRKGKLGKPAIPVLIHASALLGALLVRRSLPGSQPLSWLWPVWMGLLFLRAILEPRFEIRIPDAKSLGLRESLVCAISSLTLVLSLKGM